MSFPPYYFEKCRDLARAVCRKQSLKGVALRRQVLAAQEKRWPNIFRHAVRHSVFFQKFFKHASKTIPAITDLPILTKQMILDHFDEYLTVNDLKKSAVETHLGEMTHDAYWNHRYKIFRSGGSSGNPGVMVYNPQEFSWVLAQVLRSAQGLIRPPCGRRIRGANVYASTPTHDSIRISQSFQVGFHQVRDFAASTPLATLVKYLNDFYPDVLGGYPSVIYDLAQAQIEGRLNIKPQAIFLGSEPLALHMRQRIVKAFGLTPHDHYGTTEAIVMAVECRLHRGMHLEDDMHVIEIVDVDGKPASPGTLGHSVYVTNLTAKTQPIIRYALNDMMLLHDDFELPCPCGHPGRLISRIIGRNDDILWFGPRNHLSNALTPDVIQQTFGVFQDLHQFQLIKTAHEVRLRVLIRGEFGLHLQERLQTAWKRLFAGKPFNAPPLSIEQVTHFERSQKSSEKFRQILIETSA